MASKNAIKKILSKLKKGKTYYVKVEAYVKEDTTKVFGKYVVKKIKIKR